MDLAGEYRIEAPRESVWRALNDADVLGKAIPGCQEIDKESDTAFSAKVKARIGPVSAAFRGRVTLSDIDAPNGYTISGEGQGGVAGFAKGGARVTLEDADGGATLLRYTAEGQVGGKLAQIGARLVEGSARKIADDFFGRLNEMIGEEATMATTETPATAQAPAQQAPAAPPQHTQSALGNFSVDDLWFGVIGLIFLGFVLAASLMQ